MLLAVLAFGIWGVQGLKFMESAWCFRECFLLGMINGPKRISEVLLETWLDFPAGRGTDMSDGSGIFIENNVKISELVKIS